MPQNVQVAGQETDPYLQYWLRNLSGSEMFHGDKYFPRGADKWAVDYAFKIKASPVHSISGSSVTVLLCQGFTGRYNLLCPRVASLMGVVVPPAQNLQSWWLRFWATSHLQKQCRRALHPPPEVPPGGADTGFLALLTYQSAYQTSGNY